MRKFVLAAVTTVLALSACKGKEEAPAPTDAATEAAPADTTAATDAAAPTEAASEAPKM